MRKTRKTPEQNMDIAFKFAVITLQSTYNEYKEEVIKNIRNSFYNNDGVYSVQGDYKARQKRIADLNKKVEQLINDVEHYRGKKNEQVL